MTSPLIADFVLVDIPFEHSTPEQRKFYIYQRLSDSSLSNWDRWSRDWTWTLDELLGLAADKKLHGPLLPHQKRVEDNLLEYDYESDDGDPNIAAVIEEGEIIPVGSKGTSCGTSKLVVQRCWLAECIKAGRVLGPDCGWYVDCVEGWQFPTWDKPRPEREELSEGSRSKWTWGIRVDEYGFGFGWRKEDDPAPQYQRQATPPRCAAPSMRVVSEPVPRPSSRSGLPDRPLFHRDKFTSAQHPKSEERKFSFSKRGGLV